MAASFHPTISLFLSYASDNINIMTNILKFTKDCTNRIIFADNCHEKID